MNLLLWVLQVALALQSFAGGAYKVFQFDQIAKMPATGVLSRGGWSVVGVFEMVCGILLVLPMALHWRSQLTPMAATALAVEQLVLAVLYARYSTKMTATNPMVYVVVGGFVAAFVAYARMALVPPS
jgi:hypothetical protein